MSTFKMKEVVVVEGMSDVYAVQRAVDAEIIAVHGFGVSSSETLERISAAHLHNGVIVLTDPDHAGEKIRKTIESFLPDIKHAFIEQSEGIRKKDGRIGVEYASPQVIRDALRSAKCKHIEVIKEFTNSDLRMYGLVGTSDAVKRRKMLGKILSIGFGNGKQMIKRLNHFGISREAFQKAISEMDLT